MKMRAKTKPLLWRVLVRLWKQEQGQATTEYMLMLSVAVGLAIIVIRGFLKPTFARISDIVSNKVEDAFLKSDLHTFPVRR